MGIISFMSVLSNAQRTVYGKRFNIQSPFICEQVSAGVRHRGKTLRDENENLIQIDLVIMDQDFKESDIRHCIPSIFKPNIINKKVFWCNTSHSAQENTITLNLCRVRAISYKKMISTDRVPALTIRHSEGSALNSCIQIVQRSSEILATIIRFLLVYFCFCFLFL